MNMEDRKDIALSTLGLSLETTVRVHINQMEQDGLSPDDCLATIITCLTSGLVSFAQLQFDRETFLDAMSDVWDVVEAEGDRPHH